MARPPLPPGPYLVVGLARSGQAAARLLAARGERVTGIDAGSPPGAAELAEAGVEVRLGDDGLGALAGARCVVKSPGLPAEAPVIAAARDGGIAVIGELELAWRLLGNRFCAVTGTNGKTTVVELLAEIWRRAGLPVAVAGNVGTPVASLVGEVDPEATVICEVSSFQLEDAPAFAPECGVLLNIAPDHLDRHRTLAAYRDAKLRLFANQRPGDVSVHNRDEPALAGVELPGQARRVMFCADPSRADLRPEDGCGAAVTDAAIELDGEPLIERRRLALPGVHNAANAAAAAAAAAALGIDRAAIAAALAEFQGVAHRLERVGELRGVVYVNDSKATNVAAAVAGLRAFDARIHAILGGSLKGDGFAELAAPVAERCAACYLIGAAAERLEADLAPAWEAGVPYRRCAGLAEALAAAAEAARPGEVVLLVPACASFDAYRDFEQRGDHFRRLVGELLAGGREAAAPGRGAAGDAPPERTGP